MTSSTRSITAPFLLAATFSCALPALAQLSVPITVLESRIDDARSPGFQLEPGTARSGSFSTGVPLPAGTACDTSQFGLLGSPVGQFRVLRRWNDGLCNGVGSIEWVLVDGQADVPTSGQATATLTAGSGAFGGADLASVASATHFQIQTGAGTFQVRRQGFNLLDGVEVGGQELLSAGGVGALLLLGDGTTVATSANDLSGSVEIEENGPARAVIVARGSLRTAGGVAPLDYTARLHFYAGSARVRIFWTLRNASIQRQQHAAWRHFELLVPTTMTTPQYRVATEGAPLAGTLSGVESLDLFQGENDFPNFRDYDFNDFDGAGNLVTTKWPTGIRGATVRRAGSVVAQVPGTSWIDRTWLQAHASAPVRGVTAALPHAAALWPMGLGLDADGVLRVGLFPRGNDRLYRLRFTGHVTREVVLDFDAASESEALATARAAENPLVAKPSLDAVRRSGAVWERLLSFAEQAALYQAAGHPTAVYPEAWRPAFDPGATQYDPYGWVRHFYWGNGGGLNQYDQAKVATLDFLRLDDAASGAFWAHAAQKNAYAADQAVYHSDDFDGGRGDVADFNALPGIQFIPYAKVVYEGEHPHAYGLGLWYLLSGDERFREAYTDWGEYLDHPVLNGYDVEARGVLWHLFNLVDLYRFTGDDQYRTLAWQLFEQQVLATAEYLVSAGTDWDRGFFAAVTDTFDFYGSGAPNSDRNVASFVLGAMAPRTYAYLHDYGGGSELQRERARDVLEGVSRFLVHEHWHEFGGTVGDYGYPYRQSTDSVPPDPRPDGNWISGFKEVWLAQLHAYLLGGESEALRQAELNQAPLQAGASLEFQDWPDRQTLESVLAETEVPRWVDVPVAWQHLGGDSWLLTWQPPAGARELWAKTAVRPIVSWLGFDPQTRQYDFPPDQFRPFFAASNLLGEPSPGVESWQVDGLPGAPGSRFFALRALVEPVLFADGFETGDLTAWD